MTHKHHHMQRNNNNDNIKTTLGIGTGVEPLSSLVVKYYRSSSEFNSAHPTHLDFRADEELLLSVRSGAGQVQSSIADWANIYKCSSHSWFRKWVMPVSVVSPCATCSFSQCWLDTSFSTNEIYGSNRETKRRRWDFQIFNPLCLMVNFCSSVVLISFAAVLSN